MDLAPTGHKGMTNSRAGGHCGEGTEFIVHGKLDVEASKLRYTSSTFESFVVNFIVVTGRLVLANINRPPSTEIIRFLDELAEQDDAFNAVGGHPIIWSDLNYSGSSRNPINDRLNNRLSCYNLVAVSDSSTRMNADGGLTLLSSRKFPTSNTSVISVSYPHHRLIAAPTALSSCRQGTYIKLSWLQKNGCVSYQKLTQCSCLDDLYNDGSRRRSTTVWHPLFTRRRRRACGKVKSATVGSLAGSGSIRKTSPRWKTLLVNEVSSKQVRQPTIISWRAEAYNIICNEVTTASNNPRLLWNVWSGGSWHEDQGTITPVNGLAWSTCLWTI